MAKEIKVVELTSEQIQNLLLEQEMTEMAEKQLQHDAEVDKAILNMGPEEIVDYITEHLASSDVLVDAIKISGEFTLQDSIFIASLNRSRIGLEAAISWLENHFSLNEEQDNQGDMKKKHELPKPRRIVYGETKDSTSDDSEQL